MTDPRDDETWRDLAYTIEVVVAAACSKGDRSGAPREDLRWPELAHTTDVLLASALARGDIAGSTRATERTSAAPRRWRAAMAGAGLVAACWLLILAGHFEQDAILLPRVESPPSQLGAAKRLEIVNASRSSSIVRVQVTAPDAGIAKVVDLPEPIPPTSIQPFWHFPAESLASSPHRICLVYFSAAYASGAEADFPALDLCRDNQVLATERAGTATTPPPGPASSSLRLHGAYAEALRHSLDLYAAPSRRSVNIAKTSSDGSKVVTLADNSAVQLWDSSTGRLIAPLAGHGPAVEALAFSPDGREVITLASDNTAQRWDADTGRELTASGPRNAPAPTSPEEHAALGRDVAFRADVSAGATDLAQFASAPSQRRLRAGSLVKVVRAYGPWTLVNTDSADLGYVPSDALVRRGTGLVQGVAAVERADTELETLERRIGTLRSARRYAEAATLAATYAEAAKLSYGPEHPRYAAALDIQVQLAQATNRTSEAVLLSRRALAIREKALGGCDPAVIRNMDDLAQLYRAQGNLDLAGSLLDRSCPR